MTTNKVLAFVGAMCGSSPLHEEEETKCGSLDLIYLCHVCAISCVLPRHSRRRLILGEEEPLPDLPEPQRAPYVSPTLVQIAPPTDYGSAVLPSGQSDQTALPHMLHSQSQPWPHGHSHSLPTPKLELQSCLQSQQQTAPQQPHSPHPPESPLPTPSTLPKLHAQLVATELAESMTIDPLSGRSEISRTWGVAKCLTLAQQEVVLFSEAPAVPDFAVESSGHSNITVAAGHEPDPGRSCANSGAFIGDIMEQVRACGASHAWLLKHVLQLSECTSLIPCHPVRLPV